MHTLMRVRTQTAEILFEKKVDHFEMKEEEEKEDTAQGWHVINRLTKTQQTTCHKPKAHHNLNA